MMNCLVLQFSSWYPGNSSGFELMGRLAHIMIAVHMLSFTLETRGRCYSCALSSALCWRCWHSAGHMLEFHRCSCSRMLLCVAAMRGTPQQAHPHLL